MSTATSSTDEEVVLAALQAPPSVGTVDVKYIGSKERKTDTLCGTGTVWTPGSVAPIPVELAERFRAHPEVFEVLDTAAADEASAAKPKRKR